MQVRTPRQQRLKMGGSARLLVDVPPGLVTVAGYIVDLSEGGCALRVHQLIDSGLVGRVQVELAGRPLWLPILTRWIRADSRAWTVGCQFDRPTPEKQHAVRKLMVEQRKLLA